MQIPVIRNALNTLNVSVGELLRFRVPEVRRNINYCKAYIEKNLALMKYSMSTCSVPVHVRVVRLASYYKTLLGHCTNVHYSINFFLS